MDKYYTSYYMSGLKLYNRKGIQYITLKEFIEEWYLKITDPKINLFISYILKNDITKSINNE
jgi:hypothetical protein